MSKETLSDRMKAYESASNYILPYNLPIVVRIDGNCFHTVTKGLDKPFDEVFLKVMQNTTSFLVEDIQGCEFGYVESDEISLVIKNNFESAYFNNRVEKLCSILASKATVKFNEYLRYEGALLAESGQDRKAEKIANMLNQSPIFDCRCFIVPQYDLPNYILHRVRDAYRNCVNSYGQSQFSHNQLLNLKQSQVIDKLKERNVDWKKVDEFHKYGTMFVKFATGDETTEWKKLPGRDPSANFYLYFESYFDTGSVVTGF